MVKCFVLKKEQYDEIRRKKKLGLVVVSVGARP
jgi:hypothetical protein